MNRHPTPRQQGQILRMAGDIATARAAADGKRQQGAMLDRAQSDLEAELRRALDRIESNAPGGLQAATQRDAALRQQAIAEAQAEAENLKARIEGLQAERFRLGREATGDEAALAQEPLLRRLCERVGLNADALLRPRGNVEVRQ